MIVDLIPEVSNFIAYGFIAILIAAGVVAAVVVFAAMFRGVMS